MKYMWMSLLAASLVTSTCTAQTFSVTVSDGGSAVKSSVAISTNTQVPVDIATGSTGELGQAFGVPNLLSKCHGMAQADECKTLVVTAKAGAKTGAELIAFVSSNYLPNPIDIPIKDARGMVYIMNIGEIGYRTTYATETYTECDSYGQPAHRTRQVPKNMRYEVVHSRGRFQVREPHVVLDGWIYWWDAQGKMRKWKKTWPVPAENIRTGQS